MKHEYAFDATMFAVVRVMAENENEARALAQEVLDAADINWHQEEVNVTEISIGVDDSELQLFEIDGEDA